MAKITSAYIGLHTWTLDDGGKLIVRELPDGEGFIWTISVELWNADGEQVKSWGFHHTNYLEDNSWFDDCLDYIQGSILPQWDIEGKL